MKKTEKPNAGTDGSGAVRAEGKTAAAKAADRTANGAADRAANGAANRTAKVAAGKAGSAARSVAGSAAGSVAKTARSLPGKTAGRTSRKTAGRTAEKTAGLGAARDSKAAAKQDPAERERLLRKKFAMKTAREREKEASAATEERRLREPMSFCTMPPLDADGRSMPPFPSHAMRLGFPVKVMGVPGIKSNDTRRWQQNPHLRVSLSYLCEIFAYLRKHDIRMYRMTSDLAPYHTHPEMPQFHRMVEESREDLAMVGRIARAQDLRLSFHPSQYIVLNSGDEALTRKSIADLESQASMLDHMEMGPEAVMVIHVGGAYGDRASGCDRWVETWKRLSEPVRRRLVLENDDLRFSAADVLSIHERTGVKCVFDYQHHWCFNPEGLPMVETLERFLKTWPPGVRPKMHISCARTEMREIKRKNRRTGLTETVLQPPIWTGHADFNNPFETITFLRSIRHLDTDIMLESKAKDLSLLRLRNDIARYAPELAERYAVPRNLPVEDAAETVETEDEEGGRPEDAA